MTRIFLLTWQEAVEAGPGEAGGKGWNLGRLDRYGFNVPAGGVLSASAYRSFLQDNDLLEKIGAFASVTAEEVIDLKAAKALEELRAAILKGHLPESAEQELEAFLRNNSLGKVAVAVRSSATAEDSKEASFAGIHSSFLNVIGYERIIEAILGCYASLWTPQALAYRRKMGFSDEEVAAAVVIMQMVPSVSAGVAFSCDPKTGRQDVITVSANFGLGESVVSGSVEPDEYCINIHVYPPKVLERRVGTKSVVVTPQEGGGTVTRELNSEEGTKAVLTDVELVELANLVYRIFYALGDGFQHQDVEWSFDGKRFVVLQARPVTKLPTYTFTPVAHLPVIWSNANLKDAVPFVQSTLGWSALRNSLNIIASIMITASGYKIPEGMILTYLYKGRPYFNLTAMQWGFYDSIGMLPSELNETMGGHQPEIPIPDPYPL
ncbi:MAG TPA: PEP/pyruvate-binding domain-containing protein, partial [Anaerolineae bacterium]|nr:PEP/pyruvate-binding domain-containing protein [Anaerolineae bacterium]